MIQSRIDHYNQKYHTYEHHKDCVSIYSVEFTESVVDMQLGCIIISRTRIDDAYKNIMNKFKEIIKEASAMVKIGKGVGEYMVPRVRIIASR